MLSEPNHSDVLDAVLAALASQNRDLRLVTLEEAKVLTAQIIRSRGTRDQQGRNRALCN